MFNFFNMSDNYDKRVVNNTKLKDCVIDTCAVTDLDKPYETGIQSEFYNDGNWIIVEEYENVEDAKTGHKKWVDIMKTNPKSLTDVSQCNIAQLCKSAGSKNTFPRK